MNNFDDTANNTELASAKTTPTAKGAFDDIFPNEQEKIQQPQQQGLFDDIVTQSNIESDLKRQEQLRQEQQERLAQQQKYAWIDDVVNSPLSWIALAVVLLLIAKKLFKSLRNAFYWLQYELFDKEHYDELQSHKTNRLQDTYSEHTRTLCKEFESHTLGSIFPVYAATFFLSGVIFIIVNNKGSTGAFIAIIGFWLAYIPIYIISKIETNRFLRKLAYDEIMRINNKEE